MTKQYGLNRFVLINICSLSLSALSVIEPVSINRLIRNLS